MQSLAVRGSFRFAVLVAIAAGGAFAFSACIIGPKQDDPSPSNVVESDTGVAPLDTSIAEDIEGGKTSDSGDLPPPADTMAMPMADAAPGDMGCLGDADGGDACVTDGATDAADGG